MAGVTSLGVGSGLDLEGLLTKLMTAEQQPLVALQKKQTSYQSRISALGSLKSTLASLQTTATALKPSTNQTAVEKFATYSASMSDTSVASASAAKGAVVGTYSLEVSSLAKAQRLVSPASAFTSATTALDASGTLKIEFGTFVNNTAPDPDTYTADATRELDVDIAAGATLNDIRDAINAKNGGVTATIVTGTNGPQLILSSTKTGTDSVMRLSGLTGTDAANFDFDPVTPASGAMSETASGGQAASNAAFTLNGIAATSSSNTVTGVLDGVTLTLSKENVGTPATLTVSQNTTASLTSSLNAFVKAYNEANSTMSALGTYNASTKVAGALQGDSSLRTSQSQLRNVLFSTVAGGSSAYQHLSDIGISVGKDGALALDTTKLNKAISADYAGVANLVAKAGEAYETTLEGIVGTTGTLVTATNSTTSMIKVLTSRASTLSDRLTRIEANYRKQFAALDTLVASMNDTSSYLTQQLSALTKSSSN